MSSAVIRIQKIGKVYQMGTQEVHALRGISLEVERGESLVIMGPSGSGKSTLMNIIGCLDQPTTGSYFLDEEDVSQMSDDELANIRNRRVGFIFQSFNLLARTSALENVQLPLIYAGASPQLRRERSMEVLNSVGLGDRLDHTPNELSGGQQQRVAIARALVNRPSIILADEPTGNLDSQSGREVMEILQRLNREHGITIIMVTHDPRLLQYADRSLHLFDGLIEREQIVTPTDQPTPSPTGVN
ncbi:MAG: ABC transporter ATP-binding protein [Chloroflexota bacterium]|nr:ABC transporter ATP-binding protein [Chloroflexota bacterium]